MPYLIVRDAAKFLDFTSKVFGAVEKLKIMRDEKLIQHAEIRIGDSVIMFADATAEYQPRAAALFVYVEDADRTCDKSARGRRYFDHAGVGPRLRPMRWLHRSVRNRLVADHATEEFAGRALICGLGSHRIPFVRNHSSALAASPSSSGGSSGWR